MINHIGARSLSAVKIAIKQFLTSLQYSYKVGMAKTIDRVVKLYKVYIANYILSAAEISYFTIITLHI